MITFIVIILILIGFLIYLIKKRKLHELFTSSSKFVTYILVFQIHLLKTHIIQTCNLNIAEL